MGENVDIDRPVVKWGNSYGIRLTQAEVKRLGIRPGDKVQGRLHSHAVHNHLEQVDFPRLNLPTDSEHLDRLIAADTLGDDDEA